MLNLLFESVHESGLAVQMIEDAGRERVEPGRIHRARLDETTQASVHLYKIVSGVLPTRGCGLCDEERYWDVRTGFF